jgi:putative ABC transport system permease protein
VSLPRLSTLTVRGLRQRRARSVLSATGVALGVALFIGAAVTNATVQRAFGDLLDSSLGTADVIARPAVASVSLPPNAVSTARHLPGAKAAEGLVHIPAQTSVRIDAGSVAARTVKPLPGQAIHFPVYTDSEYDLIGVDGDLEGAANTYRMASGRMPKPGEAAVALTASLADYTGSKVGSRMTIAKRGRDLPVSLAVTGIVAGGVSPTYEAITSLPVAESVSGEAERLSEVDIVLGASVDVDRWAAQHKDAFGPGVQLQNRATVLRPFRKSLQAPLGAIGAGAALAVLIGMYLIYLTFSTGVVERVRHFGMMRAMGGTRAQVRKAVLVEAVILGAVGSVAGMLLGLVVSAAMMWGVGRATNLQLRHIAVTPEVFVTAAVVGMVSTLVAAGLPALRASRLPVTTALAGVAPSDRKVSRWALAGVLLLGLGALLTVTGPSHPVMTDSAFSLLLAGGVLGVPLLLVPAAAALYRVAARISPSVWRVAVRHTREERARAATTLGLVMVVFAMVLALESAVTSIRAATSAQVHAQFGADITAYSDREAGATFDAATIDAVRHLDGVTSVSALGLGPERSYLADHVGEPIGLQSIDPSTYFLRGSYSWTHGNDASAQAALRKGGAVLLSDPLAKRISASVGSKVRLTTTAGPRSFVVAGRFASLVMQNSVEMVVSADDGQRLFGLSGPQQLAIYTEPGRVESVRNSLLTKLAGPSKPVSIQTGSGLKDSVAENVGRYVSLYDALVGVALLIGILGLANTLAMSVLERRPEIGILRAIGTQRRTVGALFVAESATLAGIAFLLAIPLGSLVGADLVPGMGRKAGFRAAYHAPWHAIPALAIVAAVVALVAALFPALRAASVDPISVLRTE